MVFFEQKYIENCKMVEEMKRSVIMQIVVQEKSARIVIEEGFPKEARN